MDPIVTFDDPLPELEDHADDPDTEVLLSAASGFEITVKAARGHLRLPGARTVSIPILTADRLFRRHDVETIW